MKRFIFILAICIAVPSVVSFGLTPSPKHSDSIRKVTTVQREKVVKKNLIAKVVYTCPMHPEVLLDKPGKCPKCGMNLVKKTPAVKMEPKKK
ncbi:MAG: heavy metal-binding domain-containing protein [Paludibacter sp.]|nr:heavy metal-binding domain-containing protein [Paludibacter sp.]